MTKQIISSSDGNKKFAFMDVLTDTYITEFLFDYVSMPYNNLAIIAKDNKYGIFDIQKEEILIPMQYKYIGYFGRDGIANALTENGWKEINRKNEILGDSKGLINKPKAKGNPENIVKLNMMVKCSYKGGDITGKVIKITEKTFTIQMNDGKTLWRKPEQIIEVIE